MARIHPDPFTTVRPEVNYRVRACTRYAIEENQRIELFIELARGTTQQPSPAAFRQMGELMFQSHWSYTECGLGCEATDQLIDLVRQHRGEDLLFGAKITGGGAGGTVAVLGSRRWSRCVSESRRRVLRERIRSSPMSLRVVPLEPIVSEFASCGRAHEYSCRRQRSVKRQTVWYFVLLALASLIWSGQGIAVKVLDPHLGPIAITFLPFYVTTLLFVPLSDAHAAEESGRRQLPRQETGSASPLRASAGQVLAQLGMTWGISKSLGIERRDPESAHSRDQRGPGFLHAEGAPDAVTDASLWRLGWLALSFLSVGDLRQASFGSMKYLTGNLLIFGGCFGSSFYNVYCKGLMQKFQEIEILIFSYITASVASIPLLIWVEPFHLRSLLVLRREEHCRFPLPGVLHVWRVDAAFLQGATAPGCDHRFHVSLSGSRLRSFAGGRCCWANG